MLRLAQEHTQALTQDIESGGLDAAYQSAKHLAIVDAANDRNHEQDGRPLKIVPLHPYLLHCLAILRTTCHNRIIF